MSPDMFLSGFWQKLPLFLPHAIDRISPSLEADELAWLAMQEDVESRIVFTRRNGSAERYEVTQGPFEENFLASLPGNDWTLLVQDVEKHLPDVRSIFDEVDFVPDWRIDDLMISYAAPGGGVGPHMDNYDVFLCQVEGRREWRLGDAKDREPDASSGDLSLLLPFTDERPITLTAGDVLYLPPRVPHWGIAGDFCMTWSIGMRAPRCSELCAAALRGLHERAGDVAISSDTDIDDFYEDPDLSSDEAFPGMISEAAIRRARQAMPRAHSLGDREIATLLGCAVSQAKPWLEPETLSSDEAEALGAALDDDVNLELHGMARLAFYETQGTALVFANGLARAVPSGDLRTVRRICRDRCATPAQFRADRNAGLLHWLLERGAFDLTEHCP